MSTNSVYEQGCCTHAAASHTAALFYTDLYGNCSGCLQIASVSGCGPAFVYMFIEALADGGVACGLPRKDAYAYAAQMVAGSAELCLKGLRDGVHPGALKDAVCSPGGTTIEGVRTLEEAGFRGAVMDAVIAAYEKNKVFR